MNLYKLIETMLGISEQQPATLPDTETEPDIEIEPDTEPAPRKNPLVPTPGQEPEPQGMNKDLDLFMKRRKDKLSEDIDMHPSKKDWVETGDPELNAMLPNLLPAEKTYLQTIASSAYNDLVKKMEKYLGVRSVNVHVPQLAGIMFNGIQKAMNIESSHKHELEQLAIDMVLGMEEFEMVKQAVDDGDVVFKVALKEPEIKLPSAEQDNGLDQDEELNLDIAQEFMELSDTEIQRRLSSMLLHGGAVLKSFSFHLVEDELKAIDSSLPKLYGSVAALVHLGYWLTPFGIEKAVSDSGAKAGAEKVDPHGEIYIIRAEAILFPFLVHEIVKGIYNWISIKPEFSKLKRRGVEGETKDLMIGPEVFKAIQSMVPADKQRLMPLIQKHLLDLKRDEIAELLKKSNRGQQIMRNLISTSAEEWGEFSKGR